MCIHHASLEMTLLNVAINGTDASCVLGVCVYRKKGAGVNCEQLDTVRYEVMLILRAAASICALCHHVITVLIVPSHLHML